MLKTYREQVDYLRELAKKLTELADCEENERKRRRWADHNELVEPQTPLLWVCPDDDGAWLELIPPESLLCEDADFRVVENVLRKYLYQQEHFRDDFTYEKRIYITYPGVYTGYLFGNVEQDTAWGVSIVKPKVGKGAYHLDNFLKTEEDFEKLLNHEVDFIPDEEEHSRLKQKYEEALDGILEVEFQIPYSVLVQSLWIELVHLRGLENILYDLYDEAELLHQVARHMGESKARLLKRLEEKRLLYDNRWNIYTGSGGLGYTHASRKSPEEVKLQDMWGFADAQELGTVSPKMFEEFALENQKLGMNLFGMGCYGCCEPLDGKYDAIFRHITNLRRLSINPWTNVDEAVEKIGRKTVFSWKPNPAEICMGFQESYMEEKLKLVAEKTKDCYVEIILKDIRTCGGTDENLVKFVKLARKCFGMP